MNRLQSLVQYVVPSSSMKPAKAPISLEQGLLQRRTDGATPHSLFVPMHYEPNYAYPLLVWLHGPGDDERQLDRVMPLISLRNYVAVGPRATARISNRRGGLDWRQHEGDIDRAEAAAFDCIDLVSKRFHVAPQRVFIGGFASGGTMAFRLALRSPGKFAGALSLGGAFPEGLMPLSHLAAARSLPLFIAFGRDGERYSIERTCDELRLFHTAGLSVTLRQYPCGDELTTNMLSDMDRWMMELVTGVPSEPATQASPRDSEMN